MKKLTAMKYSSYLKYINKFRSVFLLLTVSVALGVMTGACRHKDLDDGLEPRARIRVVFDWSDAPDASPAGMCVYFYDSASDRSFRFDLAGRDGGVVDLPYGTWHVITYNNDTETMLFADDHSFGTHLVYSREANLLEGMFGNGLPVAPRATGTGNEHVTIPTEMLWGEAHRNHVVRLSDNNEETVVTLRPHELVCTYTFEIRNVENIGQVVSMGAALSGMSAGMSFADESLDLVPYTLTLEAEKSGHSTIAGRFYTFGHHPGVAEPHRMSLYLVLDDGRKLAYGTGDSSKWDVTSQIHSAPDPRRVHIVIDGLDIPTPIDGDFHPSADDWREEDYDLEI